MSKPIFCIAHPRACSTAFERVFMTRTKDVTCIHEPFGDAFYFGPERLGPRFENDEVGRIESGYADSTFRSVLEHIENEMNEGKRLFIKDISCYFVPPFGSEAQIAPSLLAKRRGIGTEEIYNVSNGCPKNKPLPFPYGTETEPGNPTVFPKDMLSQFHFTFLIRDPHNSIPSYYRCTIPPLDEMTGWNKFDPSEAGYLEARRIFDYLLASRQIGPQVAGHNSVHPEDNAKSDDMRAENWPVDNPVRTNGHTNGVNGDTGGVSIENADLSNGACSNSLDLQHFTNGVSEHQNNLDQGNVNGRSGQSANAAAEICVIDADDLLDNPDGLIKQYCRSVGLKFDPAMLSWDSEESHVQAATAFEKWKGFHEDAIHSTGLKARTHKKKQKSEQEWDDEWKSRYGKDAAKLIRETVDANMADYLHLKQFAMKV